MQEKVHFLACNEHNNMTFVEVFEGKLFLLNVLSALCFQTYACLKHCHLIFLMTVAVSMLL